MKFRNKKVYALMISTILVFGSLVGCTAKQETSEITTEVQAVEQSDFGYVEGSSMELSFAQNFSIEYLKDGNKIATDLEGNKLLLLQRGQAVPEEYKDLSVVEIPLQNAIYTSTTQVGFLRAFEDESIFDSIIGVRASVDTWDFDAMISRMNDGKIVDIGDNTTMSTSYDHEIIQSLNPELVFTSLGMGDEQVKLREMLSSAGIDFIIDYSSAEKDYRGTMEWLKFYSAFYNLEDEAASYFHMAMVNIEEMKKKIEGSEKPKVGWGIVAMGKVYVENSGAKSAQMVRDAGAEYIFEDIGVDQDGVTSISVEELYDRLEGADLFINRGMPKYGPDKKSITDQAPVLGELVIFQGDKVWQITDNFWNSYHDIDKKYVDLAAIFHPELYEGYEITNFILMPDVQN